MLLYKSKSPRPVDETDFLYALPRLDVAQKGWLSGRAVARSIRRIAGWSA